MQQQPSDSRSRGGPQRGEDPELDGVADAVVGAYPTASAFADVLRETYDQLYDPSRKTVSAIKNFIAENVTAVKNFAEYVAPGELNS